MTTARLRDARMDVAAKTAQRSRGDRLRARRPARLAPHDRSGDDAGVTSICLSPATGVSSNRSCCCSRPLPGGEVKG